MSLSPLCVSGHITGGKARKPPKVLELSTPTLVVTASDLSPMNLYSPSLPTASLTPALLQVRDTHTHIFTQSLHSTLTVLFKMYSFLGEDTFTIRDEVKCKQTSLIVFPQQMAAVL